MLFKSRELRLITVALLAHIYTPFCELCKEQGLRYTAREEERERERGKEREKERERERRKETGRERQKGGEREESGREHGCTPVTYRKIVCGRLREKSIK